MTEQEIISKTKAIMNEIGEEENLSLLSEDTVKIEEYIKSIIPDAVNIIIENCPNRCVNRKNPDKTTINSGIITLPEDYVKLIALQLSNWKRMVSKTYPLDSEKYKQQTNQCTTAGVNKPVVIDYFNGGKPSLLCFPPENNISLFVYEAKYNSVDGLSGLNSNDPVAISICYMCASLVYSIFENQNSAKQMSDISLGLLTQQQNAV
jgi:hypothetical protein